MGAAVERALDLLSARRRLYETNGVKYCKPWVFLITDGAPTDSWQQVAAVSRAEDARGRLAFFAVGVEGARHDVLTEFSARQPRHAGGLGPRLMPDQRDWRIVGASERGVSHAADGLPRQDAHQCFLVDARTVLLVAGDETGLFAQLGDGGIVERRGAGWNAVFWPQSGAFANVTHFVTDADALERVVFERRAGGSECVAVFTDGLERLAGAAVASAQEKADAGVR